MDPLVSFRVIGDPVAQGSMVALRSKNRGDNERVFVKASNETALRSWRRDIATAARFAWRGRELEDRALRVEAMFYFSRPRTVKRSRPDHELDLDKLQRALFDGLTGVIVTNDARIVTVQASKHYATVPAPTGVFVNVYLAD